MKLLQNLSSKTILALTLSLVAFSLQAQKIDTATSTVQWKGYHLAKSYEHVGNVKVKSGEVVLENGELKGGKVVMDMTSITNNDLSGSKNEKLVNHLKSDEFFFVEKFPEASLFIQKVAKNGDDYNVSAEVEIRGIKQPIEFTLKQSGKTFTGNVAIDRSKHEVLYGWSIENAMLSNTIDLEVSINVE